MKAILDPGHPTYVPHTWRSLPEQLWGIWRDLCRPMLKSIGVAEETRDSQLMELAIVDLLDLPARALQRIRGRRSVEKAHTGLENQMRFLSMNAQLPTGENRTGIESQEAVSEDQRKINKATTLVKEGHVRRAVRGMLSKGTVTVDERVIKALEELHPKGPNYIKQCPKSAPKMLKIDKELIKEIVKRELATGSAPGRSGWTGDLVLALVEDQECLDGIAVMTRTMINGEIKGKAKTRLLSSTLIALSKPDGGVRPIAIGEVFYRLAAMYVLKTVNETAKKALGPTQFALLPGGSEAAVVYMRVALHQHPQWTVMACDLKNAFNTRNRSQILETLYQHKELSGLWTFANWAYRSPSDLLVVDRGTIKKTISSAQGVRQGDPLSALLFALSMANMYNSTNEITGVKVVAVQDDVYFLGPKETIMLAWTHFNREIAKGTGLTINKAKTNVLVPEQTDVASITRAGLVPTDNYIKALGTILTRKDSTLRRWINQEVKTSHEQLFTLLKDKRMPAQIAFTLLRMCGVPRVLYWMRTTPPTASGDLAETFDELVMETASTILSIPTLDTMARKQLCLPVKKGGFGLRSMVQCADAAWTSGLAQAIQYCAPLTCDGRISETLTEIVENSIRRINMIAEYEALPPTMNEFWGKFTEEPANPGLQKEIMQLVSDQEYIIMMKEMEVMSNNTKKARWNAVQAPHAGLWISTAPSHHLFQLTDENFKTAARIRLGMMPHDGIRTCQCGTSLIGDPYHFLNCSLLLGTSTVRHNIILQALIRVAATLHTLVTTEPMIDHIDDSRTDALFMFRAKPAMIDVTVVNPLANSYIQEAQSTLGAAKKREKDKNRKYLQRAIEAKMLFFPFVMEATGGLGPQAEAFIQEFTDDILSGGTQGLVPGRVDIYIRKVVAFALCTGNGTLVAEGVKRSRARFEHY